jgi:hypothetical protein
MIKKKFNSWDKPQIKKNLIVDKKFTLIEHKISQLVNTKINHEIKIRLIQNSWGLSLRCFKGTSSRLI